MVITADDQIFIDRRLIDPRAVRANIERLHAENPEGSVVVQASKKSTNKMLVWVMDASRQAGVYNLPIADSSSCTARLAFGSAYQYSIMAFVL